MKIDVRSPNGNVFCILGMFKRLTDELEKGGAKYPENRALLQNAKSMKYDAILDEVERLTNGSITFTHRKP